MNVINSERGSLNALTIPLVLAVLFLFLSLGFGVWAFMGRQDYKDNVDAKIESAVAVEVAKTESQKDNEFLEREKNPLRTYSGPSQLGAIIMQYPKTWSAYSTEQNNTLTVLMQPDVVLGGNSVKYALKIEVLSTNYNAGLAQFDNLVKQGKLRSSVYAFPKVPSVKGLRFDGEIAANKQGSVVVVPLRDKTLKVSTEVEDRLGDFNDIILPNFQFTP